MNFEDATKKQLIQICQEDCPLHYKYQAALELQKRQKSKGYIMQLWDKGFNTVEIAEKVNINRQSVYGTIGGILSGV